MKQIALLVVTVLTFVGFNNKATARTQLRAPAYPLITIDPYTNLWSMIDTLYADATRHWTGYEQPLVGILTVDGREYRFMGRDFAHKSMVVPNAEWGRWEGLYRKRFPGNGWAREDFNDHSWTPGRGSFCSTYTDGKYLMVKNEFCRPGGGTTWDAQELWVRRWVDLPQDIASKDAWLDYTVEDEAEFFINGQRLMAFSGGNENTDHSLYCIPAGMLRPGRNLVAVHACHDKGKYGIMDFAILAADRVPERYVTTAVQTGVHYSATNTDYTFDCGPVRLTVTFTAPLLPENLEMTSRPVNYMSYKVESGDGKKHNISLRLIASPIHAVDFPGQPTDERIETAGHLTLMSTGTVAQRVLEKWGDNRRIDWGRFYLAADSRNTVFDVSGKQLSLVRNAGFTRRTEGFVMLGYDDVYSLNYMGTRLRPYWNRNGDETILSQFQKAEKEYGGLMKECRKFDNLLWAEAEKTGGEEYADLCTLAWRQVMAAHKLCETPDGLLVFLSKENGSNGSIGTVDLSYPSIPMFLLYNLDLAKALINPIFEYCQSPAWNKPYAAHDVGRYPLALGQNYGGDMPVEESGNMLIMVAAIARKEGNAGYAEKYWPLLTQWAEYLEKYGFDPENQLCTDDFAGHFAHNANLSVKAILGLAAYGYLAGMRGDAELEKVYMDKARAMASEWMKMADDGDHYRLTFDQPDTWSQKYNLVWDKIFGWNVFPDEVAQKEIAYYLGKQNKYGLPLDSRETYTKTDWIMWTAAMADDNADFRAFVAPVWKFMNETVDRQPMGDWIYTDRPNARMFRNRSVVGGYFIKMLQQGKK